MVETQSCCSCICSEQNPADPLAGAVLGIGNPLLDISIPVGIDYLNRFGLSPGEFLFAQEKHFVIYKEAMEHPEVEYIAGGACQNSIRACQWMLQEKGRSKFIGSIGKDERGTLIKKVVEDDGVIPHYYEDEKEPTGTCGVLITEKERCLIANVGAANMYRDTHLDTCDVRKAICKAQIFYATGFFLTVSPASLLKIGKHACENNKKFCLNLAAPFIIEHCISSFKEVLPYVDILFGNEVEALCLGKVFDYGSEIPQIMEKIAAWPKMNSEKERIVIITQGKAPTLVFSNGKITSYSTTPIDEDKIVDTNGAGDSFVGGFLSGVVRGLSLEKSVSAGQYCASQCIMHSGCKFTGKPQFQL